MSEKFKNLPIEVLDRIFRYLQQEELKKCRKVCKLWNSRATIQFMNHIFLHNQNRLFEFLELPPSFTSVVKKLVITYRHKKDVLSKEFVQRLIMCVPNLREFEYANDTLPLRYLIDMDLPTSLTSITVSFFVFKSNQEVYEFIKLLIKLRDRIRKIEMTISAEFYDVFENWDMVSFLQSCPKLTELNVTGLYSTQCLADCLPILQTLPSLKSFKFKTFDFNDVDLNSTIEYKLDRLERLDFTMVDFLPNTLLFIARHFLGLKEIKAYFSENVIKNLNHSTAFLEFLDFLFLIDTHYIDFRTDKKFYLHCLTNFISKAFTQLPANSQNTSRRLHINTQYKPSGNAKFHYFELESFRDYCNRLQRTLNWNISYDKAHLDKLFKYLVSFDQINVDVFTFSMINTPVVSRCLDLFFGFLSLMIEPIKVILVVSSNSNQSKYKSSKQIDHVTQFEIQVKAISGSDPDNYHLPFPLEIFTNLKTLHLVRWCGIWYPENTTYSLELPVLNLESLHLDLTLLNLKATNLKSNSVKLVVETESAVHLFEVSIPALSVVKILQQEHEPETHSFKLHIKIQNLQNLHLFYTFTNKIKTTISL